MFPTGFIGVCSLGVRKAILGGLTKNTTFYHLSFLEFYADSEFNPYYKIDAHGHHS
jgi:hypothetical protein